MLSQFSLNQLEREGKKQQSNQMHSLQNRPLIDSPDLHGGDIYFAI